MEILKSLIIRDRDITDSIESVNRLITINDGLTLKIEEFDSREMKDDTMPAYITVFTSAFQYVMGSTVTAIVATSSVPATAVTTFRQRALDSVKYILNQVRERLIRIRDKKAAICERVKSDHKDRMKDDGSLVEGRVSSPKAEAKALVLADIDVVIDLCNAGFNHGDGDGSLDAELKLIKEKHNIRDDEVQSTPLDSHDLDGAMAIAV